MVERVKMTELGSAELSESGDDLEYEASEARAVGITLLARVVDAGTTGLPQD
jgi:hypothetical protein